jgi:hypothetical protein
MRNTIVITKSPEEEELGKKLSELDTLEDRLVQRELDLATLQAELHTFELHYLRIVGARIARLDDLKAQIAECFAKIHKKDEPAAHEATKAREQAKHSAQDFRSHQDSTDLTVDFVSSENIKSLFREAAKRIHPDFAIDEKDRIRRTEVMKEINAAYREGNETKLRRILKEWEDSPENVSGEDIGARLIRAIRKISHIQKRISATESEIAFLKNSDIYKLKMKFQQNNSNLLEDIANELDEQIIEHQKRLAELVEIYNRLEKRESSNG